MKVIAKRTMKNAYDQTLFIAGKEYSVADEDDKRVYVLNELHTETLVRKAKVDDDFEMLQ